MSTFIKGRWAEDLVAADLRRRGHVLLFRNLRTLFSEIDIITLSPEGEVWMVEVKRGEPSVWRRSTSKAQGVRLAKAFAHVQAASAHPVRFQLAHCGRDGCISWIFDSLHDLINMK